AAMTLQPALASVTPGTELDEGHAHLQSPAKVPSPDSELSEDEVLLDPRRHRRLIVDKTIEAAAPVIDHAAVTPLLDASEAVDESLQ
ncbi:hypothetical protein BGW39_004713, partial [Mortierella sp. 14UC]